MIKKIISCDFDIRRRHYNVVEKLTQNFTKFVEILKF
jgi:hypothetical protein